MTDRQREIIRGYNFPKYYKWFYKFWTKYLSLFILCMFITIAALMIIHNESRWDLFDFIKGLVFVVFGCGLWALTAYLTKHFHLKIYLKKNGMSLQEWNSLTKGFTIDDIKNI